MQINGDPLVSAFAAKQIGLEDKSRLPVVIESTPTFSVAKRPNVPATTVVSPISDLAAQQQSRFVRTFATGPDSSNSNENGPRKLPVGVQQYLQTEQLKTDDSQRLLDEIV